MFRNETVEQEAQQQEMNDWAKGLSAKEAAERLDRYGANKLKECSHIISGTVK